MDFVDAEVFGEPIGFDERRIPFAQGDDVLVLSFRQVADKSMELKRDVWAGGPDAKLMLRLPAGWARLKARRAAQASETLEREDLRSFSRNGSSVPEAVRAGYLL